MNEPPPGVENEVGSCETIGLCADLEDVQLDLNHLKMGSGFLKVFWVVFGFWWGPAGSRMDDPWPMV